MTTTQPQAADPQVDDLARQVAEVTRLAQHLAVITERHCEVTGSPETGQRADGGCSGRAVAIRWEHGFADEVCEHHAATASARGALVIRPRRHDGTVTP